MKTLTSQDLTELFDKDNGKTSKEIKDLYKNNIEEMNKLKKIQQNLELNKVDLLSNHEAYKDVENVLRLKDRLTMLKLLQLKAQELNVLLKSDIDESLGDFLKNRVEKKFKELADIFETNVILNFGHYCTIGDFIIELEESSGKEIGEEGFDKILFGKLKEIQDLKANV